MAVLNQDPSAPPASPEATPEGPPEDSVASMLESGVLTKEALESKEKPAESPEDTVVDEEAPAETLTPESIMQDTLVKPAEDAPDDLLDDSEVTKVISGKKAQEAFKKERAHNKRLREQVAELSSQAQKVAAAEQDLEQFSELKSKTEQYETQIKELENQIGQLDLSRSPTFQAQYDSKIQAAAGKMVQLLVAEQLSPEEASSAVHEILGATGVHAREEIITDTAPAIAATLAAHANTIEELSQTRATALSEWKASAAALEESVAKERLAEMSGRIGDVVSSTVDKVVELGNPYYKTTDNDEWNAQVNHRVNALKGLLLEGDYSKLALYVAEGLVADDLRSRHLSLMQKSKGLEDELKKVIKSGPSFAGSSPQVSAGAPASSVKLGNGPLEDEIANLLNS
jgi:hypothetical protein